MKPFPLRYILCFMCIIFASSCNKINKKTMRLKAPKAKKITKKLVKHNDVRVDDYYWLNDRENKDCLLYTSPSPRDRQKSRMPSSA